MLRGIQKERKQSITVHSLSSMLFIHAVKWWTMIQQHSLVTSSQYVEVTVNPIGLAITTRSVTSPEANLVVHSWHSLQPATVSSLGSPGALPADIVPACNDRMGRSGVSGK